MAGKKGRDVGSMEFAAGLAVVAVLVVVSAFMLYVPQNPGLDQPKKFSSCDQMKQFIEDNTGSAYGVSYLGVARGDMQTAAPMAASDGASKSAEGFSTTNNQVAGVDEADIVKNDGRYIYTLSGGSVFIIDAYPAETMHVISQMNESGATQMFVNGDNLVVLGNDYTAYPGPMLKEGASSIMPYYRPYGQKTFIHVYDMSDRQNPVLKQNVSIDGNYIQSRMIGGKVYAVVGKSAYFADGVPVAAPYLEVGGVSRPACGCADVMYFDNPDGSYQFTTIASLDLVSSDIDSKVILAGYGGTIYASESNIYISYQKSVSQFDVMKRMLSAMRGMLPSDVNSQLDAVYAGSWSNNVKSAMIQEILGKFSNRMTEQERNEFEQKSQNITVDVYSDVAKEMDKTVVQKVSLAGGNVEYSGSGEVPGRLLNQFSMDEHNGFLRIATTSGGNSWMPGSKQTNGVYVLDASLSVTGSLEGLAPGESIYSARFMGDRAYLVTFKQVDPLFVIGLSDPSNPKELGRLKIPGYSNYLHPYDETHVIGIGKDVNESIDADKVHSDDAVYYTAIQGVKLSLFDVGDVANPVEVSKYVIGGRGTESEALSDHKAFLFDKGKNLLVLPISLVDATQGSGTMSDTYGYGYSFQGAYVFSISPDSGFQLTGRVTHTENMSEASPWSQSAITRSLYIGDVLYTVSQGMVKANSLSGLSEVSSVNLPVQQEIYPLRVMAGI